MLNDFLKNKVNGITFDNRPMPVPYSYRTHYRLAQLILILGLCVSRGHASLIKLQMISAAINYDKEKNNLLEFLSENYIKTIPYIKFEPALIRVIGLAAAEKLVDISTNSKISLTKIGKIFFDELMADKNILIKEKFILKEIGNKLPESKVQELANNWRTYYV
jgi:hypothetical protein